MNKQLLGNIKQYYSLSEQATGIIIILNNKHKMKIIHVFVPISVLDEMDVEVVMKFHNREKEYECILKL